MNIEEVLYLPVKREGLNIGPDKFSCKRRYRTLDGDEVASSFKAKSKEEFLDQQKPEVPKFVAEWLEYCKENKLTLLGAFYPISEHGVGLAESFENNVRKCTAWAKNNQDIFSRAWLAYPNITVEKEKLYTVEIPNPNAEHSRIILQRLTKNELHLSKYTSEDWKEYKMNQLTESEIRKDFDWAWQFAKEVE